jgi:flavodoxin
MEDQSMSKKLVAYFSASGVTYELAKVLAEAASADLYEIKPEVPYTKADLDWQNSRSRSSIEMKDPSSRPAVADKNANISAYDVVFVGFPIWWYVAPTIINTFLESYDFSGKTIVPFATSGGSGLGKTKEKLQPSVSGTAIWKEGKLLNGRPSQDALVKWVESLNL